MAVIQARKNKKGTTYQVLIRARDGHPPKYKNFPTKQEAKDWAKLEEARRLQETYFPDQAKKKYTFPDLIDRYIEEVLPCKPKMLRIQNDILNGGKRRLGNMAYI